MFRGTVPLGRVAGIHVQAHWSLLATLALLSWMIAEYILPQQVSGRSPAWYWFTAVLTAVLFLISLLAHELAHSIVAKRHNIKVERITLWLLGGMSELADEPRTARADLQVALAGPLTSFAVGLAALALAAAIHTGADPLLTTAATWLGVTNLILGIFNLLPGAPLDGGRVLRAVLWARTGDRLSAMSSAARSGRALGLVLMLIGATEIIALNNFGGLWLMLLGWFLRSAANVELMNAAMRQQLGDERVRDVMTATPSTAPAQWSVQQFLDSTAAHSHHRVFPVVAEDDGPVGVLSLTDISRIPSASRSTTTVGAACRPLPAAAVAPGSELLSTIATKVMLRPGLDLVAVVDQGRLTGIVTATDLVRACERSALDLRTHRPPTGDPHLHDEPDGSSR